MTTPGQRLKDLIEAPGILVLPGVYDEFSARQLDDMGVAVVTYPRILTAAAIKGMQNALGVLRGVARRGPGHRPPRPAGLIRRDQ